MTGGRPQAPLQDPGLEEGRRAYAAQAHTLRNSLISLLVFFAIVVALLLAVPGLREAGRKIAHGSVAWIVAGVALEVLSCLSFVVLFDMLFARIGRSLSSRLSLAELAVNSVVSVSGLAGLALGAWVLRSKGFPVDRIAKRSVLLFVLTSAVNTCVVVVIGFLMWLGVFEGSTDPLLTLLPATIAAATIAAVLLLAGWAGRYAREHVAEESRSYVALTAISGGVADALKLLREHDWRLLGAVGYWLFDNLVLLAALAAFGRSPDFWVVAMAYLLGMMANALPIPAGLVAVEGGLVGMLVLFGVRPVSSVVAAVVVYRAISLWVPALVGSFAFVTLRHEIGKPAVVLPVGGDR